MKIDGITPAGKSGETPKKIDTVVTGAPFGSYLKEALDAGKTGQTQAPQTPAPAMPVGMINSNASNPFAKEAVNQVESVLNDLDFYQNTLANAAVPQGRLQPLSANLMEKKDRLVALMPHLNDAPLKNIIAQTASVIISENSRLHTNL